MTVIVPGRFGSPTKRTRDQLSNQLAQLTAPALRELGWDVVANDMLSIVAGLIATGSDKPAKDLEVAAMFLRKYNWRRAKKMMFAAKQGVDPERVGEEFLTDEVPGSGPAASVVAERDEPQAPPSDSQDAGASGASSPASGTDI